ncbi:MAG: HNH endonuclease domain-containing protein [Gammaproteobacteria bacterium]
MTPPPIPRHAGIDTAAFSKTLAHTDASYKFLWLLALLEIVEKRGDCGDSRILFGEIFYIALKHAKAPVFRFKLLLGKNDKIKKYAAALEQDGAGMWDFGGADSFPDTPAFTKKCAEFCDYVPFRWLRPFVESETKGAGGLARNQNAINQAIAAAVAKKSKQSAPPPYTFTANNTGIIMHPLWTEYFTRNAEVIRGWCLWHFARFLQSRNPNIPAIINKIADDGDNVRRLKNQRKFWDLVMEKERVHCIYSGKKLQRGGFALDHYVPWSFVGHDNMWNLIPALPSANSSKSDNLPDGRYLRGLAEAHHAALVIRMQHFPGKGKDLVESYVADLKLPFSDITDREKLYGAYKMFIPPLIDLAKANDFKAGWAYKSPTPLMDSGIPPAGE